MAEIDVTRFLKLSGGVRYEDTFLESVSRDSTLNVSDRIGTIDQQDLLPSVILIGALSETMQLRAAFSKTLARPTFRELSPYVSFDFIGDNLFRGNAKLERTLITNYDFRWEWYPGIGEMISASVFYKKLDNPLERVLRFDISQNAESIQNVDRGEVYGIEFEMRKNLGGFTPALSNFQLMVNYAYIQSSVTIPEAEMILIRQTRPDADNQRPLAGQSPFVFNLDLAYYNPDTRIASNISFNYFGDRLSRVSQGAAPDVFERSSALLNWNISKSIGKYLSLSASATNLLDPDIIYSQRFKGEEYLYQRYQNGRTFSLGIKYSF
jgi:TonB-dependent receptor